MPPIPGVGDRSRIAQLLLARESEDLQRGLQERALGQAGTQQFTDLLGLNDLLGKGLGLFTLGKEQQFAAEQAARQREFEGKQADLDRQLQQDLFERQLRDRALSDLSTALESERGRQFGLEQDQLLGLEGDIRRRRLEGRADEQAARERLREELAGRRAERTRRRERREDIRERRSQAEIASEEALERQRLQNEARRDLAREERQFQREEALRAQQITPQQAFRALALELAQRELDPARLTEEGEPVIGGPADLRELVRQLFAEGAFDFTGGVDLAPLEPGRATPIAPRVLPRFQPGAEFEGAATLPLEKRTTQRRLRADGFRPSSPLFEIIRLLSPTLRNQ